MKKITFLLVFLSSGLFAQSTTISNDDLYTLCKVWGTMKYYHPSVSQGKVDWDNALLSSLESGSKLSSDQIITQWFETANAATYEVIPTKPIECDSITLRNFNSKWIQESKELSPKNKARLLELISQSKNVGGYYTSPNSKSIRINSENERVYDGFSVNVKMLELFRVWNAVEYFYPYKYLLDTNWQKVLKKYIPIFKKIKYEQDYKIAITQLTAEIQDTHAGLVKSYQYDVFGKLTAPFTFQVVDNGALVTSVKDKDKVQKANIQVGDWITKINGKPIAKIISEKAKYLPVSNHSVAIREAFNYLFSGNDLNCTIEGFKENGKTFKTSLERMQRTFFDEWDKDGIPGYHLSYNGKTYDYLIWNNEESRLNPGFRLDDKVYIEFASLRVNEIDALMQSYQDAKGIVIDLRSYNNNGSLMKIFDYLFSKPQFFGIKTQPDFNQPGKFCFSDNIINKEYKYIGKENPNAYKGQVIVLINEYTQSAAELWAMIFKKIPNVIFVGSQTAGADGNITNIKLTDGNALEFSGLGIYYPDGTETQRIGIQPDVIVRPNLKSIRDKEDVLLLKAFELIDGIK